MPVPEALRRLSQSPQFWFSLLTDDGPDDLSGSPDELRLSLPIAGGYGLVLDLDLLHGERTLGLRGPASSEPVQLGRAGPGRPYPAVLHFSELDVCARVIALDEPDLPHPGLVVALLARFAPAGPGDDPAEVRAMLRAAFASLRRDIEPGGPATGSPEQDPLPLFDDAAWWPLPPTPSAQVLDDEAVDTLLLAAASAGPDVRNHERFPALELATVVRSARARLAKLPQQPWYAATEVLPLARQIIADGDLSLVPDLLGQLTETGCDHPTVLDALSEPLVLAETCWMVETLAGAEPGTLLRRHLMGIARLG